MGESERESFVSRRERDLSSDDAAELEELRREAAVLREQLDNALGPQGAVRGARDVHHAEADNERSAAPESEKSATREMAGAAHAAVPAARCTAATMRGCDPQRHRLPLSACVICASLGVGFCASSAAETMIMPLMQ